jgi:peptidoglycan/LPS O-acetylase OafA/YrhL
VYTVAGAAGLLVIQALFVPKNAYPWWWRLAVLLLSAMIAAPAILSPSTARVPRWLVLCGDASYSLYLVHPLLFGLVRRVGGDDLALVNAPAALVLYVAASTAAGLILHVMLEKPLVRRLARQSLGSTTQ